MIRNFFAVVAVVVVATMAAVPSRAQDAMAPEPGIETTIQRQFEAFLLDDFGTAFSYASPTIQGMFGNSDRFGDMVRNGYPMVWRPGEVRFLELREIDGELWQKVMIRDLSGELHILDYQMIGAGDDWKINGVQILRAPDVGA